MACHMMVRGQRTGAAAIRLYARVSVFCFLSSVLCPLHAEELPDPTRPPAALTLPSGATVAFAMPRLQSVLLSSARKAAIINGETIEIGDTYAGAKLIKVSEGEVVLKSDAGLQVLKLFPGVEKRVQLPAAAVKAPAVPRGNKTGGGL